MLCKYFSVDNSLELVSLADFSPLFHFPCFTSIATIPLFFQPVTPYHYFVCMCVCVVGREGSLLLKSVVFPISITTKIHGQCIINHCGITD